MEIKEIIKQMSTEEKIDFLVGKNMWQTKDLPQFKINSIFLSDGPHGLRTQKEIGSLTGQQQALPATCFPTASLSACSFDKDLLKQMGAALGQEARQYHVDIVLGPGCNIKRNPLGGRNFEYFSEDPVLAGQLAGSYIEGLHQEKVGCSLKHFACNNQEYKRMNGDSIVDERALHEIYLKPFEIAVKQAKPDTIMASYNKVNGIHATESEYLLTQVLRKQWGFDGVVVTDWNALNDRIEAIKAGCDLSMPGDHDYMKKEICQALKQQTLKEEQIDLCLERLLKLVCKYQKHDDYQYDVKEHQQLAQTIAEESIVLLKNEDDILPVKKSEIALVGCLAQQTRYQGAGSSKVNPTEQANITDVLDVPYFSCCDGDGKVTDENLKQLKQFVSDKEKVIVFVGLPDSYEAEGYDRPDMSLPAGHLKMMETICQNHDNVIVVIISGCVVELPFIQQVKGCLYMGLAGQEGAKAIVNVLTGKVNPCGRLAESWPVSYEDAASKQTFGKKQSEYWESIYVGYRYYDKKKLPVCFPFGYGLSYSRFTYSDLVIAEEKVSFRLKNESPTAGKEVVQLYIGPLEDDYQAVKQLKDFQKIYLEPYQQKEVTFTLTKDMFSCWQDGWKVVKGKYRVMIAVSSEDIRLQQSIFVEGQQLNFSALENTCYQSLAKPFNEADFQKVYNKEIPQYHQAAKGTYTVENTISEMVDDSRLMRLAEKIVKLYMRFFTNQGYDENNGESMSIYRQAIDCPLRVFVLATNKLLKDHHIHGLLEIVNGHTFKGLKTILKKENTRGYDW